MATGTTKPSLIPSTGSCDDDHGDIEYIEMTVMIKMMTLIMKMAVMMEK